MKTDASGSVTQTETEKGGRKTWMRETMEMRGRVELPSHLFKFMSTGTQFFQLAIHELLVHSNVYLSARSDFNDPFDTTAVLQKWSSADLAESLKNLTEFRGVPVDPMHKEALIADVPTWNEARGRIIEETLDQIGLYSLCEEVHHPLMWSHYANGHKGLVLLFSTGPNRAVLGQLPIRYQRQRPIVGAEPDNMHRMLEHTLVKDDRWAYEGEWRLWQPTKARQLHAIHPSTLMGIIYGARCGIDTVEFIKQQLSRRRALELPDVKQYVAAFHPHEFDLIFDEILEDGSRRRMEFFF